MDWGTLPSFHRTGNPEPFLSNGLGNPSFHRTGNPEPFLATGLGNPSFLPPYREPGTFPVYWTGEPFLPSTVQGTRNLSCLLDWGTLPSFHRTGNPEPFLSTGLGNPSFLPPYREPGTFPVYWTEEPFLPPYREPGTFPVYWTGEPFLPSTLQGIQNNK